MKKFLSLLMSVIMVLSIVPMAGINSFAVTSGDYEYRVISKEEKTCSITDYIGSATEVTVPSEFDGYTVTGISGAAFRACTTLTSIIISDGVTSIGDGAFGHCSSLISISIPNSVTSIGKNIFFGCKSLKEAYIGSNYAVSLFERNTNLEKVILGEGVTDIPDYAFYDCTSLTSVTLPDSLTSIGQDAFNETAITSINIPDGVTSIGNNAFIWCGSLTSINVGENNKNYLSEDGVLFNKDKTELIAYPVGSTRASYIIPDSITSIGSAVFANCTSLTSVTIPDSVTGVGDYAFEGCTSLTSVTIPDSVTDIGLFAFGYYEDEIDYDDKKVEGFTIYGHTGSAAETYANENEFTFVPLESLSADYTEYDKAVEQAKAVDRSVYTDESLAVLDIAVSVDVSGKDITEQSVVDGQTKAILDAISALEYKSADYTEYNKTVEQAKAVDRSVYTDESLAALDSALAVDVNGKNITEQSVVDTQTDAILDAVNALVYKDADYTEYDKAVEQAEAVDRSIYTDESLAVLDSTVSVDVSGKDITEQSVVDEQTKAILDAVNALVYKDADYTDYNKAVEQAKAVDRSQYTDESLAVLDSAVSVDVSGKNITEQSVVDEQIKAIIDAVNALVYKDADYTEYNKAVEQATAVDRTQYTDESLAALDGALAVDVSGKNITEQSVVDEQTKAIIDAVDGLKIKTVSMYRLYNPNSGEHFYTANTSEKNDLVSLGWTYEGIGWTAPKTSSTPVYRLYNHNGGEHHYTLDASERDFLVSLGWTYEGIGWYSDDAKSVPVYRQYNPNAFANNHNYTTDKAENDWLVGLGWRAEGIGWYGVA